MTDESTTEQVQFETPTAPATGEQIDQLAPVAHQEDKQEVAERFFNNSGAAIDMPPAEVPEDDDMKAIRSEWTFYPAEVNKSVSHQVFDEAIGTTIQIGDQSVEVTRKLVNKVVSEVRATVGDLGMNAEEAKAFVSSVKRAGKGEAPQDRVPGRESAVEMLNAEHGVNAAQALRAARAYVEKNPKLGRVLELSGLGDDPATVATIARRAFALQRSGKLKVK